ncbi:MAG: hypothetical protein IJU23_11030 [Proteobacteria bacterium]|nr:hypothetical protein [Pseudomonadota bacterium]
MEKLNVSYYLSERLVSKIDERSVQRSGNRSRQVTDDLGKFYDMLDAGLNAALDVFPNDDLRVIIGAIKARPLPGQTTDIKTALMTIVGAPSITAKIETLDDIACYALWDWARTNR